MRKALSHPKNEYSFLSREELIAKIELLKEQVEIWKQLVSAYQDTLGIMIEKSLNENKEEEDEN